MGDSLLKTAVRATSVSHQTVMALDGSSKSAKHKESLGVFLRASRVSAEDEDSQRQGSPLAETKEEIEMHIIQGDQVKQQELVRKDLSFARLKGDFSGKDLHGALLVGAILQGANFNGAVLRWCNFEGADLSEVDFTDADLRNANLSKTLLTGATLCCAWLQGAKLAGAVACPRSRPLFRLGAGFSKGEPGKYELKAGIASGLKWTKLAKQKEKPTGEELEDESLATELRKRTVGGTAEVEFTEAEWDKFGIQDLRTSHIIKAGNVYFRPTGVVGERLWQDVYHLSASIVQKRVRQLAFTNHLAKRGMARLSHRAEPALSSPDEEASQKPAAGGSDTFKSYHTMEKWQQTCLKGGMREEHVNMLVDMRGAKLMSCDMQGANLSRANLRGANCVGANLGGTKLDRACLEHCNLEECRAVGVDLTGAFLAYARFNMCDLRFVASMHGADLRGASLVCADLANCKLRGLKLLGANLRFANLRNADLRGACLAHALLLGANLQRAKLDKAILIQCVGCPLPEGVVWELGGPPDKTYSDFVAPWTDDDEFTARKSEAQEAIQRSEENVPANTKGAKWRAKWRGLDGNLREARQGAEDAERMRKWQQTLLKRGSSSNRSVDDYADLQYASLRGSILCGSHLMHTHCAYADMAHADLRMVFLNESCLEGVTFENCTLTGTKLAGASFLQYALPPRKKIKTAVPSVISVLCCGAGADAAADTATESIEDATNLDEGEDEEEDEEEENDEDEDEEDVDDQADGGHETESNGILGVYVESMRVVIDEATQLVPPLTTVRSAVAATMAKTRILVRKHLERIARSADADGTSEIAYLALHASVNSSSLTEVKDPATLAQKAANEIARSTSEESRSKRSRIRDTLQPMKTLLNDILTSAIELSWEDARLTKVVGEASSAKRDELGVRSRTVPTDDDDTTNAGYRSGDAPESSLHRQLVRDLKPLRIASLVKPHIRKRSQPLLEKAASQLILTLERNRPESIVDLRESSCTCERERSSTSMAENTVVRRSQYPRKGARFFSARGFKTSPDIVAPHAATRASGDHQDTFNQAVSYEASEDPSSPRHGSMIHLNLIPKVALDLRVDPKCCSTQTTVPYQIAGPSDAVELILGPSSTHEKFVSGFLSPLTPITLSEADCKAAGIPTSACSFAFAYPLDNVEPSRLGQAGEDDDGWLLFVQMGGFVYFDRDQRVLQINAIAPDGDKATRLTLIGPAIASATFVESLDKEAHRMRSVTLQKLLDGGFEKFGWVHPAEKLQGKDLSTEVMYPDGAFVYKMRDGPPVMYVLAMSEAARKERSGELAKQATQRGKEADQLTRMHRQLSSTVRDLQYTFGRLKFMGARQSTRRLESKRRAALQQNLPVFTEVLDELFGNVINLIDASFGTEVKRALLSSTARFIEHVAIGRPLKLQLQVGRVLEKQLLRIPAIAPYVDLDRLSGKIRAKRETEILTADTCYALDIRTLQQRMSARLAACKTGSGKLCHFFLFGWLELLLWIYDITIKLSLRKFAINPKAMRLHTKELHFLQSQLKAVAEISATQENWSEFSSAWEALLSLRSHMTAERGQAVLECIALDAAVLRGVGVACVLRNMAGTDPPDGLLKLVKSGPAAHIKSHDYIYQMTLEDELVRISNVRIFQERSVTLLGTAIFAMQVALFNVLARYWYDTYMDPASDP